MNLRFIYRVITIFLTLSFISCLPDLGDISSIRESFDQAFLKRDTINKELTSRWKSARIGLMIEESIINPAQNPTDEGFELVKQLVHQEWYNEILKKYISSLQFQRLEQLRIKYGYIKTDASKPIKSAKDLGWKDIVLIIVSLFGVIAVIILYAFVREKVNLRKSLKVEKRRHQEKLNMIRNLHKEIIIKDNIISQYAINIEFALKQNIVRILSLKGNSISEANIELELIDKKIPQNVKIPIGTSLVSGGNHQTMAVREDCVVKLDGSVKIEIPVTCIEFHKAVPQTSDSFTKISKVSTDIQAVLNVSRMAEVGWFVTQLAIWQVTDNIHPSRINLGNRFDQFAGRGRTASAYEIELVKEIVTKAREIIS